MDSLIVLRRPLRKSHLIPKYSATKKTKKFAPKVEPIPPEPGLEEVRCEPATPISFVKLYEELCLEKSRHSPPSPQHLNTPEASHSAASLRTHYDAVAAQHVAADGVTAPREAADGVTARRVAAPSHSANTELMLQLDYAHSLSDWDTI